MSKKDWKKQLFRVKQIADQNLGRVEKSEVLSEELQHLDKKVDLIKKVYHDTGKKLKDCYQGREGQDFEKRLRKLPEYAMSHTMKESATMLKEDTLMGSMFSLSGDAAMGLASELLQYEIEVERRVINPVQTLLENDIPTIQKLRKQLSKLTLDMDSARGRYDSARRNTQMQGAKLESIKDELEESQQKVESCRDQLTTEMYSFVAKEADYSNLLLELITAQSEYHRKSLELCDRCLPRMQEQMDFHSQMPVFSTPLEDHLRRTNRDIALVIEMCVCVLLEIGMDEEGLFRIAGAASKAKKLKAAFNSNQVDMEDYVRDVHCIAGALKLYLRELPEPLMTFALYNDWMQAAHMPANQRMEALWHVVNRLPKPNYNNLRYLIKFLHKLSENQSLNKMSAGNIAIVIGPNLIWPEGEGGPSVLTTSTQSAIVEALITHAEWFFPGDCDFRKTGAGEAASPPPVGIRRDRFLFPAKEQENNGAPQSSAASAATTSDTTSSAKSTNTTSSSPASGTASAKPPASNSNNHTLASMAAGARETPAGARETPANYRETPASSRESPTLSVFHRDRRKVSEGESSLRAGLGLAHKTLTAPVSSPPSVSRKDAKEKRNSSNVQGKEKLNSSTMVGKGKLNSSNVVGKEKLKSSSTGGAVEGGTVPLRTRVRGSSVGRFEMGQTAPRLSVGDRSSLHGDTISLGGTSYYPLTGVGAQTWRDKPISMTKPDTGSLIYKSSTTSDSPNRYSYRKLLNSHHNGTSGGVTSGPLGVTSDPDDACKGGSYADEISDTVSEPGGRSAARYNSPLLDVHRAITPPPRTLPPRAVHSDMYNTVFALQALNCDGWSDYLTRVRGLWDGHMNTKSQTPSPRATSGSETSSDSTPKALTPDGEEGGDLPALTQEGGEGGEVKTSSRNGDAKAAQISPLNGGAGAKASSPEGDVGDGGPDAVGESSVKGCGELSGGGEVSGASSEREHSSSPEVDFGGGSSNHSSPAGTLKYSHSPSNMSSNTYQEISAVTTAANTAPPVNVLPTAATPVSAQPAHMAPVTSGSTGSLSLEGVDVNVNGGSANSSPRPPRRTKKVAPPPPERPHVLPPGGGYQSSAPATSPSPVMDAAAPKITIYPSLAPVEDSDAVFVQTEKAELHHSPPKIPDRPQIAVGEKPNIPERPSSPRAVEKPPSPKPDRPRGPPPERPGVPPPEKPPPPAEKPSMPAEKPSMPSEKPSLPAEKPPTPLDKPAKPEKPPVMEKPKSPVAVEPPIKVELTAAAASSATPEAPPAQAHQRQPSTGSRPPRPNPPPPPPPRPNRDSTGSAGGEESPPKPPERKESMTSGIEEVEEASTTTYL